MDTVESHLKQLDLALKETLEWLRGEFRGIRSGRPSVELVEDIKVKYAETQLAIKQLGSLSVVPPREIRISVWDQSTVGPVMKAIEEASVGLSVSNDGNTVRASLSALGSERKEELSKLVRKQTEEARIRIRGARDEALKKIKAMKDEKTASEDQFFKGKESSQKLVDETNKAVEEIMERKLAELEE